MDEKYEPELDFNLLSDWCAFCEGSREFSDHYHFSTILMGVFLGGLTPEVNRFLQEFSKYFPQSLFDNLVRICGEAEPDRDVLPWVHRDLDEKRKLFDSSSESVDVLRVIDERRFTHTHDHDAFQEIKNLSINQSILYSVFNDFVIDQCKDDDRLWALNEALYHIATDYFVANSIMAPLLETDINLGNFFEVYLRGGDYVLDNDRIVVYTYKPARDVSV